MTGATTKRKILTSAIKTILNMHTRGMQKIWMGVYYTEHKMSILNILTKERYVAGIEISDSVVRIALFRSHKKGKAVHPDQDELILIEEPISANIIADGVVLDVELLSKTLREIWDRAKLGTDYAIVGIPDDKIYSKIFSFPKSVDGMRLTEAMRLAIGFQLPMKTEDIYLDWERTGGTSTTNEILLSTIPREVANGYVEALEKAGIKIIALESHLASIARAVKTTPGTTTLFSKKTPDGATIFALKDGILRFSRTLPLRFVSEDQISSEVEKVRTSLASEEAGDIVVQELTEATVRDEYAERAEITNPKSKWLVALGSTIRGKMPEGTDNLVSLLPIGTEEAYAYQRVTSFALLMRNLTISVSMFFIVAYVATYFFMYSLLQNTTKQIATLSDSVIPPEIIEREQQISDVNSSTETGVWFLSQTPKWSTVLEEITRITPDGIAISMFSAPIFSEKMFFTGTAINRVALNDYKKILQESPLLLDIELPLTNLEKKEKIPFTISFRLKDPSGLYYTNASE
ncbi:MAG: Type IV pilus assembly protein PilM [Candidatus Nomurabacteria bacterium GW2011_GWA2_42_41]|nr:MAG: Type IV pilus assembly protein PilM [Candidatus Nomurabacteria bacterium GW2011_GWA2_42_41]